MLEKKGFNVPILEGSKRRIGGRKVVCRKRNAAKRAAIVLGKGSPFKKEKKTNLLLGKKRNKGGRKTFSIFRWLYQVDRKGSGATTIPKEKKGGEGGGARESLRFVRVEGEEQGKIAVAVVGTSTTL